MSSSSNKPHRGVKQRVLTPARRAQNRESQARYRLKQKRIAEEEARTDPSADSNTSDTSLQLNGYTDLLSVLSPVFSPPNITSSGSNLSGALFESPQTEYDAPHVFTPYPSNDFDQSDIRDNNTSISHAGNTANNHLEQLPVPSLDSYAPLLELRQQLPLPFDYQVSDLASTSPAIRDNGHTTNSQKKEKQLSALPTTLPSVPFLFNNHIRLQDMTFLAATLAIAASINVTPDDYLNDRPSPFFLLSCATSIESAKVYFGLKAKPHLQPSLTQLSRSHASYLDLIIFPQFRERATLLATTDPYILDQQQLFNYMLAGGMTCWGNVEQDVAARGSGVPWDMRSWEAKPWFLKKWWFLVTANDEIHEISRLWRAMRNEAEDESANNNIL